MRQGRLVHGSVRTEMNLPGFGYGYTLAALVRSHQSTSAGSFGLVRPAWIKYPLLPALGDTAFVLIYPRGDAIDKVLYCLLEHKGEYTTERDF